MEKELFNWTAWDGEPDCMTFYNVTLKVSIGKYPAYCTFDSAVIQQNDGKGYLQLYDYLEDGKLKLMGQYELHYRVGDEI